MFRRLFCLTSTCAFVAFAAGGCVHTPRGTSVEIALARRADVVRLPTPHPAPGAVTGGVHPSGGGGDAEASKTEKVADAFSRGEFCMKAGKDQEAIVAFREVVKIDPKFSEAWSNLAALYERGGQDKLALEAFRKSKTQ